MPEMMCMWALTRRSVSLERFALLTWASTRQSWRRMTLHPSDRLVCVRNSAMMRTYAVQMQLTQQQERNRLTLMHTSMGHIHMWLAAAPKVG